MTIKKLANEKGLKISIAAGNIDTLGGQGYVQAISPARAGAFRSSVTAGVVRTASGINSDDTFWDYSAFGNFNRQADGTQGDGPPDFAEPASDIVSLWPGKELARCSGTSFAAAHLSGLLLYGTVTTSARSIKDPSAHKPGTDPSDATNNYDPNRLDPIGVHQ
jgi:hypothetical protein